MERSEAFGSSRLQLLRVAKRGSQDDFVANCSPAQLNAGTRRKIRARYVSHPARFSRPLW